MFSTHISLIIHILQVIVMRVSPGIMFPRTHILRDACFPVHISLIIHILQVIVMRVSPSILFPHHLYADLNECRLTAQLMNMQI